MAVENTEYNKKETMVSRARCDAAVNMGCKKEENDDTLGQEQCDVTVNTEYKDGSDLEEQQCSLNGEYGVQDESNLQECMLRY